MAFAEKFRAGVGGVPRHRVRKLLTWRYRLLLAARSCPNRNIAPLSAGCTSPCNGERPASRSRRSVRATTSRRRMLMRQAGPASTRNPISMLMAD